MEKKILTTPISAEDLEGIKAGDIVYLTGLITTCRDVAHRRLIEYVVNCRLTCATVPFCTPARL